MKNINWIDHLINFVSVILGVSLAFYVSNWSENNKNEEESRKIVASLISELDLDIGIYEDFQISYNQKQAKNIGRAISYIQTNQLDSLPYLLQNGIGFQNYAPRKVTFNSLTSSGKLNLIEDYELQMQISSFYDALVTEAQLRGEHQVRFYNEQFMPMMIETTDLTNPKLDEVDLIKTKNSLLLYQRIIQWKVEQYEEVLERGKSLRDQLYVYLEEIND